MISAIAPILVLATLGTADVAEHANAILEQQLACGAIPEELADGTLRIDPYSGNLAALGLIEAYRITDRDQYLDGAIAWTDWYLEHSVNGAPSVYEGTANDYEAVGEPAYADATAATFTMVANHRRLMTRDRAFAMREKPGVWGSFSLILDLQDYDGLTLPVEGAESKELWTNAWVYRGLRHSRHMADAVNDMNWLDRARYVREQIEETFDELRSEEGLYPAQRETRSIAIPQPDGREALITSLAAAAVGPLTHGEARATYRAVRDELPPMVELDGDESFWLAMAGARAGGTPLGRDALSSLKAIAQESNSPKRHGQFLMAHSILNHKAEEPRLPGLNWRSRYIEGPPPSTWW
ncbi:MAG: hypothetical protein R6W89_11885 [Candidatus Hydrogenedentota bacterium]